MIGIQLAISNGIFFVSSFNIHNNFKKVGKAGRQGQKKNSILIENFANCELLVFLEFTKAFDGLQPEN